MHFEQLNCDTSLLGASSAHPRRSPPQSFPLGFDTCEPPLGALPEGFAGAATGTLPFALPPAGWDMAPGGGAGGGGALAYVSLPPPRLGPLPGMPPPPPHLLIPLPPAPLAAAATAQAALYPMGPRAGAPARPPPPWLACALPPVMVRGLEPGVAGMLSFFNAGATTHAGDASSSRGAARRSASSTRSGSGDASDDPCFFWSSAAGTLGDGGCVTV